jgi:hypothetical protein
MVILLSPWARFYGKSDSLVKPIRDKPEWLIQVPEKRQLVVRAYNKAHFVAMRVRANVGMVEKRLWPFRSYHIYVEALGSERRRGFVHSRLADLFWDHRLNPGDSKAFQPNDPV